MPADEMLPAGAYEAADEAFETYRVGDDGPRDELEAALLAAAERIRADERERIGRHLEALARASGGESQHAYRNAVREIMALGLIGEPS